MPAQGVRDTLFAELNISNFAIIEKLQLRFSPGFNVLTGETGAGKSIIVDAVGALLGGRVRSEEVRSGMDRAQIEGLFLLEPHVQAALEPLIRENGLEGDDEETLMLAREIRASGRTIARVNGRAVTVGLLREIGQQLVDIHGQSEHLSLSRTREHLGLLDRYAGLEMQRRGIAETELLKRFPVKVQDVGQSRVVRTARRHHVGGREDLQRADHAGDEAEEEGRGDQREGHVADLVPGVGAIDRGGVI